MSYKTLLVCLNSEAEAKRLIPVACQLANQFDAHLIGLYSIQNLEIYASISMQLSSDALAQLQSNQQATALEIKKLFDHHTHHQSFVSEWRQIETSTAATGERLAEQARCADLVIMSQLDPEHNHPGPAAIMRRVIEHSGRPVLVVPLFGTFDTIGKRTLIGWSGTRESARAVHDAIPLMLESINTQVFWVIGADTEQDDLMEHTGHETARCLNRHGITASVSHRARGDAPVGDELLNEASDSGADLIVTGAYGHSRLYDLVIGATTSHLLKYMTTPVLFSA